MTYHCIHIFEIGSSDHLILTDDIQICSLSKVKAASFLKTIVECKFVNEDLKNWIGRIYFLIGQMNKTGYY